MEEISELRPERQEAATQGKNKGRNLGKGNDKCEGPAAGGDTTEAIVSGPDGETLVIEVDKIQDTKALIDQEVNV